MAENKLQYLPIQEEKLHSTGRGKHLKVIFPYAKKKYSNITSSKTRNDYSIIQEQ